MIYLAAVCALALLAMAYAVRAERQANSQREKAMDLERGAWATERRELLQRIQAPELAVLPEGEPIPYVAPDDDQGYWDALEERTA